VEAILLIAMMTVKGPTLVKFDMPSLVQCKAVEPIMVAHFSRYGSIVEHHCELAPRA
jgi:hypothetical protein